MKDFLTAKRARELFRYDAETGKLYWRVSLSNVVKEGSEAGCEMSGHRTRYVEIRADYVVYMAHRLIWLIAYGEFPTGPIDHIDGNGLNNKLENLRGVTAEVNQKNRRMSKNNTSGFTGINWDQNYGRWVAKLKRGGKAVFIGGYTSKEEAAEALMAYKTAHPELGFTMRHGIKEK